MVLAKLKSGVVYQWGKRLSHVDITDAVEKLRKVARALRWYGMGIMILGLAGMIWVWGPLAVANLKYQIPHSTSFDLAQDRRSGQANPNEAPNIKSQEYTIYIPKIGAISRVIPDIDANNKEEYLAALKLGVAEAAGLAHPGEKGTTFLFAHSVASPLDYARYNAVFYLLDKLESGDEIQIVYKNKLLRYRVAEVQRLKADDTRYLRPQSDEELLVLQTCWPAGTRAKRLVLTAKRGMVY